MSDTAQINAKINGDASGFTNAVDQASGKANQFATGALKKLGSAVIAAFAVEKVKEWVSATYEAADALADLSEQTGVSTNSLQALQIVAKKSGVEFSDVANAFKKIDKATSEAVTGNDKTIKAFKDLGITVDDLKNKDAGEIFYQIVSNMQGSAEAGSAAISILGKNTSEFKKLLGEISGKDLKDIVKELTDAGFIIEEKMIEIGANTNKWMEMLGEKTKTVFSNVVLHINGLMNEGIKSWYILGKSAKEAIAAKVVFGQDFNFGDKVRANAAEVQAEDQTEIEKKKQLAALAKAARQSTGDNEETAKTGSKREDMLYKSWENRAEGMSNAGKLSEYEDMKKARQIQQDEVKTEMEFLLLEEKIEAINQKILKTKQDIIKEQDDINKKETESADKLIEQQATEEKLVADYEDEISARNKAMAGVTAESPVRFNEVARYGGQLGGQGNIQAGNAIRQISIQERMATIAAESDKKLAQIIIAIQKNAEKGGLPE